VSAHHNPPDLHLRWVAAFHGSNPYADTPVVVADITPVSLPDISDIRQAVSDLWVCSGLDCAPDHGPGASEEGDAPLVLSRSAAGWAQAVLNEVRGYVQHADAQRTGDAVRVWVGFHDARLSRLALQLALQSLVQLLKGELDQAQLTASLQRLWQACRKHHPDYQARILMVGARTMGLPCLPFLPGSKYWQFGWGVSARVFMESSSNQDGTLGQQWAKNKTTAKTMMKALGLPTPAGVLVMGEHEVQAAVASLGFPCVLKPLDGGAGRGVTANIRSMPDAHTAFHAAHGIKQGPVLAEAHVPGDDHRLMVIDGRFVAAIRREPSFVVGDGHKTIAELVAELNLPRSSNMVRSRYLRRIALDEVLQQHLATQSLSVNDVLPPGQRVTLRSNANLSTGGLCTDVTAVCHPQIRAMAVLLGKTSGLATIGIDYITTDITRLPAETGGAFIEFNTTPGLDACVAAGWPEAVIARCVLGESVGSIPVDLTVIDAHDMHALGQIVSTMPLSEDEALVIGTELRVGVASLRIETDEPWSAVKAALRNAAVRTLHVICSADDLVRLGCPVDRLDHARVAMRGGQSILSPVWIRVLEGCGGQVESMDDPMALFQ
jgi:cyanophycin synthetase